MKVYISVDIEGICDVVNTEHAGKNGYHYRSACEQMTREAAAAVEGAIAAGATEVVVNDSHGSMTNLIPMMLPQEAKLITGATKPMIMMQDVDSTYDAIMFVGYHARMNTPGVMSHTINWNAVDSIYLNGKVVGETGFNTAIAGYYGVPVVMVTGDQVLKAEVEAIFDGNITFVQVKEAITRNSAKCLHPLKAVAAIKEAAQEALNDLPNRKPLPLAGPTYTGEVQFINSGYADNAARLPGSIRESGDTVSFTSTDSLEVLKAVLLLISLCS